jgi:hypothetical protein
MPRGREVRDSVPPDSLHRGLLTTLLSGLLMLVVAVVPTTSANAAPSTPVRSTPLGALPATLKESGAMTSGISAGRWASQGRQPPWEAGRPAMEARST